MPVTRVYRAVFNSQVRLVEASHPNAAVAHLARQLLTEIRPATPKEVADHFRSGAQVEVAGAAPVEPAGKPEWPVEGATDPAAGNALLTQFSSDRIEWHNVPEVGDNFVRYSPDGNEWGEPLHYEADFTPIPKGESFDQVTGESAD